MPNAKLLISLGAQAVKCLCGWSRLWFIHWGVEELCSATQRSSTQTALWNKRAKTVTSRFVISFLWKTSCCVAQRNSHVSELTGNLLPASPVYVEYCFSSLQTVSKQVHRYYSATKMQCSDSWSWAGLIGDNGQRDRNSAVIYSLLIHSCAGIRSGLQEKERTTEGKGSNFTAVGKYLMSLLMLDQRWDKRMRIQCF